MRLLPTFSAAAATPNRKDIFRYLSFFQWFCKVLNTLQASASIIKLQFFQIKFTGKYAEKLDNTACAVYKRELEERTLEDIQDTQATAEGA